MTWVDDVITGIEEGLVVIVFRVMVKGEPGVWELGKFESVGLFDEGVSLISPNNGVKSSLLGRESPFLWVALRDKG